MPVRPPPLIAALHDPRRYPHPVSRVEMIETHISWVLLAGEYAYKIKKPVDLGFLDFTTLAKRRFFCEEEVHLNRRLTRDVYLGLVELTGTPPDIRVGGAGPVIEYAVRMRRLPADRMLDDLVRHGRAEPGLIEAIGEVVARFHATASTGGEIDDAARIATIRRNWAENFDQTAAADRTVLPREWRRALSEWVEAALVAETGRFEARIAGGRARDGHGDLQAAHVCCSEPIQVFDCIEFNRRFRYGDTAADIAFLMMDLEHLGRPDLATRFLNAYLEETGDWDAVALLDFYRAYRAFVRGKVLSLRVPAGGAAASEARGFFRLALDYTRPRGGRRLCVTSGVMGSGKSTVAKSVAAQIGAVVVRTDVIRKRLAGVPATTHAIVRFGEGLYTEETTRRTYAEALRIGGDLLRAGWSVVIDGSFPAAAQRADARALARASHAPLSILWCDAPDTVIAGRLDARRADRHEPSDARAQLLPVHRSLYERPDREPEVIALDTTRPASHVLGQALAALGLQAAA